MTAAVRSVEAALEAGHAGANRREGVSPAIVLGVKVRKAGERASLKLQETNTERLPV
jgi:hypothetical protein